jgi:choline dehydrogenase-like flavoprotein
MPTIFNLRGYTHPDPLDKAPAFPGFLLLSLVNIGLSVLLIRLITGYHIVTFQGFTIFGRHFSALYTEILEVIINGFIYTPLVLLTRKCSFIVPFLIVFLPYYILDLHIESYYRLHPDLISKALWLYDNNSPVSGIQPAALKFLFTISVDAVLFGVLSLFLARLLAGLIYAKRQSPPMPTRSEYATLFRPDWSQEDIGRPRRDAAFWILRLLGIGYAIYLGFIVIGMAGNGAWPGGMRHLIVVTYSNTALAINTFFKISLMSVLAFAGAYNKAIRYYCCIGLLAGHSLSACFSLIFHFFIPGATESSFLLLSGIIDGVMALIFLVILLASRDAGKALDPEKDHPADWSIPMTLLKTIYCIAGILFLLMVVSIVYIRLATDGTAGIKAIFGYPDPLISNTITFYGTIGVLFLIQVSREQLRAYLFNPTIIPLLAGSVLALAWFVIGEMRHKGIPITIRHLPGPIVNPLPDPIAIPSEMAHIAWYFGVEGVLGLSLCLTVIGLRRWSYQADYGVNTVSPSAAFSFLAMAQAFFGGDDKQRTEMLGSVDNYMGSIRSRKRGLLNAPFGIFENGLNFIYGLHPPFSSMSRDEQRYYLRKYFLRNEWERRRAYLPPLAEAAWQIGIALNTFVSFAEFNHLNPRYKIGYVPVDARDRTQGDCAAYDPPFKQVEDLPKDHVDPLNFKPATPCADGPIVRPRVTTPVKEAEIPAEADYIIIGSGAGGATAAYRLACNVPHPDRILVIETGNRYQPLQDFSDDEMSMFAKLYKEGGLQQTKQFTMTVAQGECVGGTTVINNAVCFPMPDAIQRQWADDFGLGLNGLADAYQQVATELNIQLLGSRGINQTTRQVFVDAVNQYNNNLAVADQLTLDNPVKVNHRNNTGDGNWNIGNKRMQKRSMLETYIPWAESRGVQIVPNTTASAFLTDGTRATHVILRSANGKLTRVKINKALIVAAGAVASSQLLMRSNAGGPNVGKRLSCNFAFPVSLEFDREILAFDGDQITIAALDPHLRSAFETYFNPPATFSITSVPFFFDRRDRMMGRYRNLINFGSLIGSEPRGVVLRHADLIDGRPFEWDLGPTDAANIKYSLETLLELGRLAGARRAILPTKPGIELDLTRPGIIADYAAAMENYPLRITDLYIGTAHPQGGNLMAADTSRGGVGQMVVDEEFKVKGYDNVFVADASVFPTSITVNPQWTIMALSTLAMQNVVRLC